jgi:signal transduction histidine kinase
VRRIRDLMADLRPSILDDLGLTSALRWYTQEFGNRTRLRGIAQIQDIQPRLPPDVETSLFRIAQEALTNVAKHAGARQFIVRLEQQDRHVVLAIIDDGVGFDFGAMRLDRTKTGVGIVDMRERAEAIGGQIWIDCQIGKGTRVRVQVPRLS